MQPNYLFHWVCHPSGLLFTFLKAPSFAPLTLIRFAPHISYILPYTVLPVQIFCLVYLNNFLSILPKFFVKYITFRLYCERWAAEICIACPWISVLCISYAARTKKRPQLFISWNNCGQNKRFMRAPAYRYKADNKFPLT